MAIESADLTIAVLRLPNRFVLMISVYVEPENPEALMNTIQSLKQVIERTRNRRGMQVDVIIAGDFNRHDHLWGEDDVSQERQAEADSIIHLMSDYSLRSLLSRGIKTWQNANYKTTIDLILASEELASMMVKCMIHSTEHESDHMAIETAFDVLTSKQTLDQRLLFKNAL